MNKDWNSILNDKNKLREYSNKAFQKVDIDKNGYITVDELETLLTALSFELNCEKPTQQDV